MALSDGASVGLDSWYKSEEHVEQGTKAPRGKGIGHKEVAEAVEEVQVASRGNVWVQVAPCGRVEEVKEVQAAPGGTGLVQVAPGGKGVGHKDVAEDKAREQLLKRIDALANQVGSDLNAAKVALWTTYDLQRWAQGLEKWAKE